MYFWGGTRMKRLQGLIAATLITGVVALGMVGIGVNAATNPDSVQVNDSPAQTAQAVSGTANDRAQVEQLQGLIKQYQAREQQYEAEIRSLSQQLSDANAQANQARQILEALQQRGLIRITSDGQILLRGG
jgi:peptidoglycan hydrolase CwlO-like protein